MKILIVEDEKKPAKSIFDFLKREENMKVTDRERLDYDANGTFIKKVAIQQLAVAQKPQAKKVPETKTSVKK